MIIPAFNVEDYIADAVDSVLRLCPDGSIALVLVNDGSADDTPERLSALKRSADPRASVTVVNQPNLGVAAARNAALRQVQTPFVGFLDADDMLAPEFTRAVLPAIRSLVESDVDIVEFNSRCFEEHGRELNPIRCAEPAEDRTLDLDDKELEQTAHRFNNYLWCRVFRTSLFQNERFPEGQDYEDVAVVPSVYLNARRIHRVGVDAVIRRYRSGSIMRTPSVVKAADWLACHRTAIRRAREASNDPPTSRYWTIVAAKCFEGLLATVIALPRSEWKAGRRMAEAQLPLYDHNIQTLPSAEAAVSDAVLGMMPDLHRRQLRRRLNEVSQRVAGRNAWRRRSNQVRRQGSPDLDYFWKRVRL